MQLAKGTSPQTLVSPRKTYEQHQNGTGYAHIFMWKEAPQAMDFERGRGKKKKNGAVSRT